MLKEFSLLSLDWLSWLLAFASVIIAGIGIMIGAAGWRMNDDDFGDGEF